MKFLFILLVGACQIAFGQDRDVLAFAGCYELHTEGQPVHLLSNYHAVPSRLQLTVERNGKSGTFLATRLDSGVDEESWDWHVLRDGSVEVGPGGRGWITDGWVIHLSRSGPEFRGKAWYWTDTGGGGRTFGVVVHKIACIQPRKHPRFGQ